MTCMMSSGRRSLGPTCRTKKANKHGVRGDVYDAVCLALGKADCVSVPPRSTDRVVLSLPGYRSLCAPIGQHHRKHCQKEKAKKNVTYSLVHKWQKRGILTQEGGFSEVRGTKPAHCSLVSKKTFYISHWLSTCLLVSRKWCCTVWSGGSVTSTIETMPDTAPCTRPAPAAGWASYATWWSMELTSTAVLRMEPGMSRHRFIPARIRIWQLFRTKKTL